MRVVLLALVFALVACGDDGNVNPLPDGPPGDFDNDGILDPDDNCPEDANADQANADADSDGDVCDDDDDNDSILDAVDNCPLVANTDQVNLDGDGSGDACDDDADGDTILDAADNCPTMANTDQANLDADNMGDVCDPDDDNDSIPDAVDNCAIVANSDQTNSDTDADGNACDTDDDDDGLTDDVDNCPSITNDQTDTDGDGIGDACDGIFPTVTEQIVGGNLVAAGNAWSAREDEVIKTSADITIAGIPAGATIHKAFLYWTTIGTPFPSVTFNNVTIQGAEIGQAEDTCWLIGKNFMYRADVTALVPGNGVFPVTNILSSTDLVSDGQGASLVVIYVDPADTRTNFVKLSDGALGFVGNGGLSSVAATIDGFTLTADPDKVIVVNIVADGQDFLENMTIQGTDFGAGDPFSGGDGPLWDTRIDDVTALVTTGATEVTTTISSNDDCLAWSLNAVVIENFAGTLIGP